MEIKQRLHVQAALSHTQTWLILDYEGATKSSGGALFERVVNGISNIVAFERNIFLNQYKLLGNHHSKV